MSSNKIYFLIALSVIFLISLLVNGIFLFGWLGPILVSLSLVCIGLGWYCYRLILAHQEYAATVVNFKTELVEFSKHVEEVYNMDTFYGDETLKQLLDHAKYIVEEVQSLENVIAGPLEMGDNDEAEEINQEEAPKKNISQTTVGDKVKKDIVHQATIDRMP